MSRQLNGGKKAGKRPATPAAQPRQPIIVALDMGTTNSSVAVMTEAHWLKPVLINSERSVPTSIMFFDGSGSNAGAVTYLENQGFGTGLTLERMLLSHGWAASVDLSVMCVTLVCASPPKPRSNHNRRQLIDSAYHHHTAPTNQQTNRTASRTTGSPACASWTSCSTTTASWASPAAAARR
jgi:hypothetical protein